MAIMVSKPTEINEAHLQQIINLIVKGGQIKFDGLRERLLKSDYIAFTIQDNKIICTAALKNPIKAYRTKVFKLAEVESDLFYEKELGYIVTSPDFEGQGHCTTLLNTFIPKVSNHLIFATTRKQAIIHILEKFGFCVIGSTYGDSVSFPEKKTVRE